MKKRKHDNQTDAHGDSEQLGVIETPPGEASTAGAPEGSGGVEGASAAELQERVEKLTDALARAKADFQNLQRRTAIERSEAVRYANADLMRSLLAVLDDFERSLAAAQTSDNLEAVVEGVRLVHQNLWRALTAHGLDPIDALHQPFDPSIHEALLQQPSADYPAGTVIEQAAKGYRLHDRVLRPARVVVSKAAEPPPDVGGDGPVAPD